MKKNIFSSGFGNGSFTQTVQRMLAIVGALGLLALVGAGVYYLFAPEDIPKDADTAQELEIMHEKEGMADVVLTPFDPATDPDGAEEEEPEEDITRNTIPSGATAGKLLQEWMGLGDVNAFVEACAEVFPLNRLRAGQPYAVTCDPDGFCRFEYEIDSNSMLIVDKNKDGAFKARIEPIHYEMALNKLHGTIQSSLFNAMTDQGETAALAVRLAEIFAWEINFIRDIQPDDSFSLLVEKRFRDGEFAGYGKILAADFTNKSKLFEAYIHVDEKGRDQYYNATGESLKRAFLKAPLSFTRISSRFSMNRKHPILGYSRPHPAVDYAAPTGTPVMTVGDGTVTFVGRGKGAGNYITVQHPNSYETSYLHLSRFAKGLKKGQRVSQGEVIGYVGSTGYSTGPHLDFRMKQNGNWVNPETALSPKAPPLGKDDKEAFMQRKDVARQLLSGDKGLNTYSREEFFK